MNEDFDYIKDRAELLGRYIAESGATVRETSAKYGISKSTVHKDINERLSYLNPSLYALVREVLEKNKAERHIRGGLATKMKYERLKEYRNKN